MAEQPLSPEFVRRVQDAGRYCYGDAVGWGVEESDARLSAYLAAAEAAIANQPLPPAVRAELEAIDLALCTARDWKDRCREAQAIVRRLLEQQP